jgi:peptidyl-prolyl isomerase G (cyclophilin G)
MIWSMAYQLSWKKSSCRLPLIATQRENPVDNMTDTKRDSEAAGSVPNRCFFEISIGGEIQPENIVMQLDTKNCPKTSRSFMALCTSSEKTTKTLPQPTYRGCEFHRVVPGFVVQGGDFERFDGTGGYSPLFGNKFADEYLQGKHDQKGLLSMANSGRNTNGSQFFITLQATPHLDGKHVVFGRVVQGMDTVQRMVNVERDGRDRPVSLQKITIVDCGLIAEGSQADGREAHRTKKTKKKRKKHSRSSSKKRKRAHRSDDETSQSSYTDPSDDESHRKLKRKKKSRASKKSHSKASSSDESSCSGDSSSPNEKPRRKRREKKRKKKHKEKRQRRDRSSS